MPIVLRREARASGSSCESESILASALPPWSKPGDHAGTIYPCPIHCLIMPPPKSMY